MALTRQEVERIARLAHLKLSEEEMARMEGQLSTVLEYVERVSAVDTEGLEPTAHVAGATGVYRDDEVRGCDPGIRRALLEAAPDREGDLVRVKAVFE